MMTGILLGQTVKEKQDKGKKYEHIMRGIDYGKEGKFELAKQEFQKGSETILLRIIEDVEKGIINEKTAICLFKGKSYLDEASFFDAIDQVTEAIALNPKYAQSYADLGLVYYAQAKISPAWMRVGKGKGSSIFNVGEKEGKKMLLENAIVNFNKAIDLDPKCVSAYSYLAWIYYGTGDNKKAIYYYDKYIELGGPPNQNFEKALKKQNIENK